MDRDTGGGSTNRPYAPPSNLVSVLHRLRQRNPPARIDAEFLRDLQVSDGTINRVLFGLRFLNLIEDDYTPTLAVRSIATSTDEEYQEILGGLLREAYSDVFERLDPTGDTQDKFLNFFRRFTPASQRERMVIFFLGMCREAGMQLADAPRQRASAATMTQSKKASSAAKRDAQKSAPAGSGGELQDTGGVPAPLLLLIRSLPPEGSPLPEPRRKQWLTMAEAALAFVYPEQVEDQSGRNAIPEDGEE